MPSSRMHNSLRWGYTRDAIKHRIDRGRLHVIYRGVYAVGRPQVTRLGGWMAATLAGDGALSHSSAAALFGFGRETGLHVSTTGDRRPSGITVHRRKRVEVIRHPGIPVTTPLSTLIDLAATLKRDPLEAAISEADTLNLVHPDQLRRAIGEMSRCPTVLREIFHRWDFVCTRSILERHFRPIAARVGLPSDPLTHVNLNGFEIDFYYPRLRLVIETDGLRYHRNAWQQTKRARSQQAHVAAGLTPLFFTRYQVVHESEYVEQILRRVRAQLAVRQ